MNEPGLAKLLVVSRAVILITSQTLKYQEKDRNKVNVISIQFLRKKRWLTIVKDIYWDGFVMLREWWACLNETPKWNHMRSHRDVRACMKSCMDAKEAQILCRDRDVRPKIVLYEMCDEECRIPIFFSSTSPPPLPFNPLHTTQEPLQSPFTTFSPFHTPLPHTPSTFSASYPYFSPQNPPLRTKCKSGLQFGTYHLRHCRI